MAFSKKLNGQEFFKDDEKSFTKLQDKNVVNVGNGNSDSQHKIYIETGTYTCQIIFAMLPKIILIGNYIV